MYVEIGNAFPIVPYRDEGGTLRYKTEESQRVTRLEFPAGWDVGKATLGAVDAIRHHTTEKPAWIESDNKGLLKSLLTHYDISTKANVRPADWGKHGPGPKPVRAPQAMEALPEAPQPEPESPPEPPAESEGDET